MSLNIKNAEAHELSRELARLTGESITTAVTTALRERLARVRDEPSRVRVRSDALLAIGRDAASRLDRATREVDHGELLYDEQGLPR